MRVLGEGRVVPEAHVAVVIADPKAVVNHIGLFLALAQDEGTHVQTLEWEVHLGVQLLTTHSHHPVLALAALEAFERDNQQTRQLKQFQGLHGLHVLLARVAVPHVLFVKHFALLELSQAIFQLNFCAPLRSHFTFSIGTCHRHSSGHVVEELVVDVLMPHDLDLELLAAFRTIVAVERSVRLKLQLVQYLLNGAFVERNRATATPLVAAEEAVFVVARDILEEQPERFLR